MISVNTKKIMGELLFTIGMSQMQIGYIKTVLANQNMFILEHVYQKLMDKSTASVTPNSLKSFLTEAKIEATVDEILTIFDLYSKFSTQGLSLCE